MPRIREHSFSSFATRIGAIRLRGFAFWVLFSALSASIAAGQSLTEFPAPGTLAGLGGIVSGPDGALWFTQTSRATIGRISTAGSTSELPIPFPAIGGITLGPDGALWFPVNGNAPRLGRLTTAGAYSEVPLPFQNVSFSPGAIAAGPDGNLWLAGGSGLARVTVAGVVTQFAANASAVTSGPDGNVWFTGGAVVGRITPAGQVAEFPLSGLGRGISTGPDGNVWVAEAEPCSLTEFCGAIARVRPSGEVTEFTTPDLGGVIDVAPGSDGNVWFVAGPYECHSGPLGGQCLESPARFGRITSAGVITQFDLEPRVNPRKITRGPDGNLWFTEFSVHRIARIVLDGSCRADAHSVCLNQGRFRAEISWRAEAVGSRGLGTAVSLTADSAAFWFFTPNNLEVVVKVVDGRVVNGRFWVFVGALSDVEYEVTVTDTETGAVRRYEKPAGTLRSLADTSAF